jgi:hypothetical protein
MQLMYIRIYLFVYLFICGLSNDYVYKPGYIE